MFAMKCRSNYIIMGITTDRWRKNVKPYPFQKPHWGHLTCQRRKAQVRIKKSASGTSIIFLCWHARMSASPSISGSSPTNKQIDRIRNTHPPGHSFLQHILNTEIHCCPFVRLWLSQVLVASARAHVLLKGYIADVELATPAALQRLLAWKDTREQQELGKDSTDSTASVSY